MPSLSLVATLQTDTVNGATALLLDSGGGWLYPQSPQGGCLALRDPLYCFTLPKAPSESPLCGRNLIGDNPFLELEKHLLKGLFAVGFIGYELAPYALELPKKHLRSCDVPLMHFAFFDTKDVIYIPVEDFAKQAMGIPPIPSLPKPNMTGEEFERMVNAARGYIERGDIYQVNLSQRFTVPFPHSPVGLIKELFLAQPVPFAALLRAPEFSVVSGSMELFLEKRGRMITTRPIKGTRARRGNPFEDARAAVELKENPKERAENLMIVDLMRNDLGRVAKLGTVRVDKLFCVKPYATLYHMESQVSCELRGGVTLSDILKATFPPGSVTGAPKRRAVELIDELEPHARGPYCGAIGVFYPGGDFKLSVAIRTGVIRGNTLTFWTGGGIVWDSDPKAEYEETLTKARAFIMALTPKGVSPVHYGKA